MSFDMRRRQEGTRKRGYLDSTLETPDNNSYNHSSKAYAVHDSSYEDLDRLIMFITESKQIQGRYYVRYLPGMMNSSGELTPCNYRPTFSFSPPRSPAPSSATTTPTNRLNNRTRSSSLVNNRSSLPDVVDLTEEDDMISKSTKKNKGFLAGIRPYSDGRRVDRRNSGSSSDNEAKKDNERKYCSDDDDGDDEKSGQGSSSSSGRNRSAGSTRTTPVFTNRKQTARKSMKARTEVRPSKIPDIKGSNSKSEEEDDDEEKSDDQENSRHSITGRDTKDTSLSSADGSPSSKNKSSESKNKSSTKDDSNSNNNISSNNNAPSSSSSSSKPNIVNNTHNNSLSDKWNLLDGITVTVNPDFG